MVNGGLDLKYGINDAFTLDMILIPDFGQTRFDNSVLNLSAFEVQYAEQRPFFTEGTEMFTKGDLFYSRRIGSYPSGFPQLNDNEVITDYPASVDLLNAVKVSGRTDKGLGIGFFNAVTEKTFAGILDTLNQIKRKSVIEPLTNYNVTVLDQRFGQNNSISLVNTNVWRGSHFQDANVTGLYTDITNKSNTWKYYGSLEGSWVLTDKTKFGTEANAGFNKISGKHRYQSYIFARTQDYDIDDLGFTGETNYWTAYLGYNYRFLQPKGKLNNWYYAFNLFYNRRITPDLFSNFVFNFNTEITTKNFNSFGTGFEFTPFEKRDIYEPRKAGRHVNVPTYYNPWVWFSTDYRKKLALDATFDFYKYNQKDRNYYNISISPRYRFSDKFRMNYQLNFIKSLHEQGYVSSHENTIYFGERNRNTIINGIDSQYTFNKDIFVNLAFRHYYSEVEYSEFFNLENDGSLTTNSQYNRSHDTTYNSWNLDFKFNWWFAPGSLISVLYRNSIESFDNYSGLSFHDNLDQLFDLPQLHSLSLRVTYFIDYNQLKNKLVKKSVDNSNSDLNPISRKFGKKS